MQLSIIIPAFNEEARLGRTLDAYLPYFSGRYGDNVEIMIIVNGSRDQTAVVARDYAARYRQVRVIIEPSPVGKGGAIMLGFARAQGERVGYVDADGATPPEAFQQLVEHIGSAGAIIASRWLRGAQVSPRQPLSRRIASRLFNKMVRLMFGFNISDTQCGAKLMTGAAVRRVLPYLGITRWAFDVDLLFQLHRAGFEIVEIPTVWRDVSGSRLKVVWASLDMLMAMVRLRLIYSPLKWIVSLYDVTLAPWIHPKD
ncbi:MAG: glycosyltransferase family 2 protein [Verrucomicrobia bacterium]|nr:glycosyltransferase family 2 protein [Verrucomicrobiota bacterium]MBU4248586.1 glycosyltransferase family 2 protein [Verrucomicrobiota bacterium]MBU4290526.1 glycosyltransferase family 2 protein [Verrucomicrobiota bacterium]MCG2680705.1 glycosyltransferase family 2 protein [Kiritimatiellia bacterium]